MKMSLLIASPLKDPWIEQRVTDYLKRASVKHHCVFTEVKGEKIPPGGDVAVALDKEATRLVEKANPQHWWVALDADGVSMSSEEFCHTVLQAENRSVPGMVFFVGSAYGLAPSLVKSCGLRLSLSKMTFPHQLAVLMLAEQIYRAASLATGSPYHK
ncbi:MAG: 23S rRNA (pseudouridine(1915)-N(3))-methyltransferase RlmH [Myxococcales bacterium]|nr:23S rRNA (pseudouridine(1915)-N(3))-methyltransferase RlmH [Myxococcales bacterium]